MIFLKSPVFRKYEQYMESILIKRVMIQKNDYNIKVNCQDNPSYYTIAKTLHLKCMRMKGTIVNKGKKDIFLAYILKTYI